MFIKTNVNLIHCKQIFRLSIQSQLHLHENIVKCIPPSGFTYYINPYIAEMANTMYFSQTLIVL